MPDPTEAYLDANASAPLRPEARAAIVAVLDLGPGNASSAHGAGRRLRRVLGDAREAVAALVGARPSEILFTSGATEANALAIHGALAAAAGTAQCSSTALSRRALVTTLAEHSSVARVADRVEAAGHVVRRAGVDRWGRFDAGTVVELADGAALVSTVLAQSVTGAIEPVAEIGSRLRDVPLHVDAVQAAGRVDLDVGALGAAFVSLSAHKIGGPHGVGALVLRDGVRWRNPVGEGAQELGRRPGTEAVALAAGFGAAAVVVRERHRAEAVHMKTILEPAIRFCRELPGAEILSPAEDALPNTLLVAFDGCPGDAVAAALDARGVRVSTGSACASGARLPPDVLIAAGLTPADASRAVRISTSWASTPEEIVALVLALPEIVARVRAARPTS